MPTPADATIRAAIASAIETAAPLARVYSWWVLGADENQWLGYMRSPSDTDSNNRARVHGYLVTRRGSTAEYQGNRQLARRTHTYFIYGFHYYSTGTEDSNSEATFTAEIDAICDALDDKASLDTSLSRSQPIAWEFDLKPVGGELVHIARGTLTVQPCG